jgi:hypothetical protein
MRALCVALSAPAFALALQGCGTDTVVETAESLPVYNCPAACQQAASTIAQVGFNEETSGSGEMDPATVCQHEAITSSFTCGACERAIADTYRIHMTSVGCDCPYTSLAAEQPDAFRVSYVDNQCTQVNEPFSPEACQGFRNNRHQDPASCTMPSPFSFAAGVVALEPRSSPGDVVGPLP